MAIRVLLSFITFMYLQSCSSSNGYKEVISRHENGRQKLVFIYDTKADSSTYKEFQYFKDGSISFEGAFLNGAENGEFKWYFENGKLSAHQFYDKGKKIDTTMCYYESGKIKRLVAPPTKDSLLYAIEFYETGQKKIETYLYNSDFIDKSWIGFYKNGKVKEKGKVHKGQKIGIWEYYSEQGKLVKKEDQTADPKTEFELEQ